MTTHLAAILSLLAALSTGCSNSTPEDACNDTLDAILDVAERCGADRDAVRASLTTDSQSPCAHIAAIRDETELYEECLPALKKVTCEELGSGPLPASCEGQLLER